jgi:hypothetical protein
MNYKKKEVAPLRTRKGTLYQKGTNEVFKIMFYELNIDYLSIFIIITIQ